MLKGLSPVKRAIGAKVRAYRCSADPDVNDAYYTGTVVGYWTTGKQSGPKIQFRDGVIQDVPADYVEHSRRRCTAYTVVFCPTV